MKENPVSAEGPVPGASSTQCAYHELQKANRLRIRLRNVRLSLDEQGISGTGHKVGEKLGIMGPVPPSASDLAKWQTRREDEVLGLQPGDRVEVKSADEIRETLDSRGMNKGLCFMLEMWQYCGQQFRVLKRMERLMIERTGAMRNLKNTVLLDGTTCDGSEHQGCDASCHHYWHEVWLRRVE